MVSSITSAQTFNLTHFKSNENEEKGFIEISNNNYIKLFNDEVELNADVQLETYYIIGAIDNYKLETDSCDNITISFKIKDDKLKVIITKRHDEDYYLINIFKRFSNYDIYFKGLIH